MKTKKKKGGSPRPEIYITHEKTGFFKAQKPELKKFCKLANQAAAITYGYWGAVWRNYITEAEPVRYEMIRSGQRLFRRISEVDRDAQKLYDKTVKSLTSASVDPKSAEKEAKRLVTKQIIQNPDYLK